MQTAEACGVNNSSGGVSFSTTQAEPAWEQLMEKLFACGVAAFPANDAHTTTFPGEALSRRTSNHGPSPKAGSSTHKGMDDDATLIWN